MQRAQRRLPGGAPGERGEQPILILGVVPMSASSLEAK